MITVIVYDGPASLRWINILANYLGFGLTPAVPILLAAALDRNQSIKYALWLKNIYLICYFASIFYLLVVTLRVNKACQNKSKNSVYFIAEFLLAGTIVQMVFPQIHVTWLCVTIRAILFLAYCNGMWQL